MLNVALLNHRPHSDIVFNNLTSQLQSQTDTSMMYIDASGIFCFILGINKYNYLYVRYVSSMTYIHITKLITGNWSIVSTTYQLLSDSHYPTSKCSWQYHNEIYFGSISLSGSQESLSQSAMYVTWSVHIRVITSMMDLINLCRWWLHAPDNKNIDITYFTS